MIAYSVGISPDLELSYSWGQRWSRYVKKGTLGILQIVKVKLTGNYWRRSTNHRGCTGWQNSQMWPPLTYI